jgi:hypothetical protein
MSKKENKLSARPTHDPGTPEISRRHRVKTELAELTSGHGGKIRLRVIDGSAIDRLLIRREISLKEHEIATEVLADIWRAGILGIKISNPEGVGSRGAYRRDLISEPLLKLQNAIRVLDTTIGVEARHNFLLVFDEGANRINAVDKHDAVSLELFRAGLVAYQGFLDSWRSNSSLGGGCSTPPREPARGAEREVP